MPQLCKYGYQAAAASHRGRVRTSNEDAFGICADDGLFIVCDGMGGAAAGEIASHVAVDTVMRTLCTPPDKGKTPPSRDTDPGVWSGAAPGVSTDAKPAATAVYPPTLDLTRTEAAARLRHAVADANHLVFSQASSDARLHGMGTTLVALLAQETRVLVAHVGDSRCYRFRAGTLEQLTRDHSLVDEQVKLGQLTREEAERSPLRNVITRAVGSQRSVSTEIGEFETQAGDIFLLCSDGLTRELPDPRIQSLMKETKELDVLCQQLIDSAVDAGGRDNVTCIIVRTG